MARVKDFVAWLMAYAMLFALTFTITEVVRQREKQDFEKNLETAMFMIVEKAYYDGQKDYMEGDVRIELDKDSNVVWSKSLWNDNRKCLYQPKGQKLEKY